MAIKLKAKEQKQYVGKYAGQYRYVMSTELYNKLTERIREALDAGEFESFRQEYSEKLGRRI